MALGIQTHQKAIALVFIIDYLKEIDGGCEESKATVVEVVEGRRTGGGHSSKFNGARADRVVNT